MVLKTDKQAIVSREYRGECFVDNTTLSLSGCKSSTRREHEAEFLILVMQNRHVLSRPTWFSLDSADEVWLGRGVEQNVQTSTGRRGVAMEIRVPDPFISTDHARLGRSGRRWTIVDEESKNGVCVDGLRVQRAPLESGDLVEIGNSLFLYRSDECQPQRDASRPRAMMPLAELTSVPSVRERLLELAVRGYSQLPVLLSAEPGVHLQPVARALHTAAERTGGFASLEPGELARADDEVVSRALAEAGGGSLFVADVDRLPFQHLVELRDRCAARQIWLIGGAVVASGPPEPSGVFQHLTATLLSLPPVRDRREDLGLLLAPLIATRSAARLDDLTFTLNAGRALFTYDWPLNADELATTAAAIAAAEGDRIELSTLPAGIQNATAANKGRADLNDEERARCDELVQSLERNGGNISAVARDMNKGRTQIRRWLLRFRIDVQRYRQTATAKRRGETE